MYNTGTTEGLENSMVIGNADAPEMSAEEYELQRDALVDMFLTLFNRHHRVPVHAMQAFWSWFDDRVRDEYSAESQMGDVICLLMRGWHSMAASACGDYVEGLVGQYVAQNFDELAHLLEGE